ncbi:MAG: hypothetical protein OXR66_01415 [Candidatus Woesearchaeota archaeon]|nr:hypothetical protein [Candidatus Woesearchaeota archaeon]
MRIVYGISGEGKGHATRSETVISYLQKKGHDVHIFASDFAYTYLKKKYKNVYELPKVPLFYKNGSLQITKSVAHISVLIPRIFFATCMMLRRHYRTYKPDIIISDFDVFTAMSGGYSKIPVIAANNISLIRHTPQQRIPGPRFWPVFVDFFATWQATQYVIPAFISTPKHPANVTITAPAIRQQIKKLKPTNGKRVLVYQTSPTNTQLLATLKQTNTEYIIYGYGARPKERNLTFHAFNETTFYKHLAAAKAVILGGGFTLLTEAIYLRKPILCVPLRHHYEQCFNAHHIAKEQFGEYIQEPTPDDVEAFLRSCGKYAGAMKRYLIDPNEFPRTVLEQAEQLTRSSSTDYTAHG